MRLGDEDIGYVRTDGGHRISFVPTPIVITYTLRLQRGILNRKYEITFTAEKEVPPNVIFYEKDNGAAYPFGEPLVGGIQQRWYVRAAGKQPPRLFIRDKEAAQMYHLRRER